MILMFNMSIISLSYLSCPSDCQWSVFTSTQVPREKKIQVRPAIDRQNVGNLMVARSNRWKSDKIWGKKHHLYTILEGFLGKPRNLNSSRITNVAAASNLRELAKVMVT